MKLNEALEMGMTSTSDVEGIKKRVGIVKRKVPAGYTKYNIKKRRKKKKNETK